MDTSFHKLVGRSSSQIAGLTPTMVNLLIALLVLVFVGLLLAGVLIMLRNRRRSRKQSELPLYNEKRSSSSSINRRRLTITTSRNSRSIHVLNEKQNLIENSTSPPISPDNLPEIRITFPEEHDEAGRPMSGRVVVVRVGDNGVGLEPLEENLPPYTQSDSTRFHSLDMDRMGGLKESGMRDKF